MRYGAWVRVRVRVRARDTPPAAMYPQQSRVELTTAILRLAFCFLLFQHKPMATRPLLVVCTLAIRSPPLMQAQPATLGLKCSQQRGIRCAWGSGVGLRLPPQQRALGPKGQRAKQRPMHGQRAQRCARRIGAGHVAGENEANLTPLGKEPAKQPTPDTWYGSMEPYWRRVRGQTGVNLRTRWSLHVDVRTR